MTMTAQQSCLDGRGGLDGHEELRTRREDSAAGQGEDGESSGAEPPTQMCPKDKGYPVKVGRRNAGIVAIRNGE